ncbi:uncharacterized protein J8A68_002502 [[Candida] subhashii]|uniref:CCHC-type domain-containing protein n=1 Tax=[Candida] subhashii TaxID=561895 RepID=A0A8J5QP05_9ASCO|nr:uncharacterized protein J8A68_002502 [[Candida] subhashii]KAG7664001.1 hypothetical protein J8A68_002502 [[Candida] subhashii]
MTQKTAPGDTTSQPTSQATSLDSLLKIINELRAEVQALKTEFKADISRIKSDTSLARDLATTAMDSFTTLNALVDNIDQKVEDTSRDVAKNTRELKKMTAANEPIISLPNDDADEQQSITSDITRNTERTSIPDPELETPGNMSGNTSMRDFTPVSQIPSIKSDSNTTSFLNTFEWSEKGKKIYDVGKIEKEIPQIMNPKQSVEDEFNKRYQHLHQLGDEDRTHNQQRSYEKFDKSQFPNWKEIHSLNDFSTWLRDLLKYKFDYGIPDALLRTTIVEAAAKPKNDKLKNWVAIATESNDLQNTFPIEYKYIIGPLKKEIVSEKPKDIVTQVENIFDRHGDDLETLMMSLDARLSFHLKKGGNSVTIERRQWIKIWKFIWKEVPAFMEALRIRWGVHKTYEFNQLKYIEFLDEEFLDDDDECDIDFETIWNKLGTDIYKIFSTHTFSNQDRLTTSAKAKHSKKPKNPEVKTTTTPPTTPARGNCLGCGEPGHMMLSCPLLKEALASKKLCLKDGKVHDTDGKPLPVRRGQTLKTRYPKLFPANNTGDTQ